MFCQRSARWKKMLGERPERVEILERELDEWKAFERECFYISRFLSEGADLANIASGGPGGNSWNERAREILSTTRRGENSYWYGKERGEFMQRLKAAQMKKCPQPRLGAKLTPEHKAVFQAAGRSPEAILKRAEKMRGRKQSQAAVEKRIAALRGRALPSEHREAISRAKRGRPNGLEGRTMPAYHREAISKATQGRRPLTKQEQEKRLATWKSRGMTTKKAKAIICVETGATYRCAKEAALAVRGSDKHIQACCVGRRLKHKNLSWKYL
jgi:hypothetical protein